MNRRSLKGAVRMPMRADERGVPIEVILIVALAICLFALIGWGIYIFG